MKFKKILITSAFFATAMTIAPTAVLLSSCSSKIQASQIVTTNKTFAANETSQLTTTYSFPKYVKVTPTVQSSPTADETQDSTTTTTIPAVQPAIQALYDNAKKAKEDLEQYKSSTGSTLGLDDQIWLDSYITQWDIKIKNIETGLIYLGADPISGSRMLSSRSNSIANNIKDAINIYDLNPETGDPDTTKPSADLIKNINSRIDEVVEFIQTMQGYLTDGMQLQILPSQLTKKSFIKQTLRFFYQDLIGTKLNGNSISSIKVTDLFATSGNSQNTYFTTEFKTVYEEQASKIGFTNNDIEAQLKKLSSALDDFMKFYCGDYYTATGSYGGVVKTTTTSDSNGKIEDLTLSKTNGTAGSTSGDQAQQNTTTVDKKEVEQTLTLKDGTQVYGVGFTDTDLKTENVGIGYMTPVSTAKSLANKAYSGNDIYQQMLYNNNSVNTSAQEIYNDGVKLTAEATTKMKQIASLVIKDIYQINNESEFNPTIWYTADPFSTAPELKDINSILNKNSGNTADSFEKFNVWLNQEDFFFGREKLSDISDYWVNKSNSELVKYQNIVTTQGYKDKWAGLPNINGSNVTVSGDQALAGAVLSLLSYTQFKDSTQKTFSDNFKTIDDYVLSPYNFDIREEIGVGMEGPRGSKQFQYNADPYYGLQKWSVASLTTHEGAMGHHTQQQYWTQYMPGTSNGKVTNTDSTPGYSFEGVAYHEGWAVFAEWFAAELGTYGTWEDGKEYNGNVLPTNWSNNTSTILNIKDENNPTDEEISFIKQYHGGVYWEIVKNITKTETTQQGSSTSSKPLYTSYASIAVAATKLANMLSYYGFLNEAQLRNMRMALDTAVHYKGINTSGTNGVIQGGSSNKGASIQNQRDFMKKNSGLGAGDISSESIRYMSMPSQATGYMLGKQIIQKLYDKLKVKVKAQNSSVTGFNFVMDSKPILKSFFDLILRNGEIPMQVLVDVVEQQFDLPKSNNTSK